MLKTEILFESKDVRKAHKPAKPAEFVTCLVFSWLHPCSGLQQLTCLKSLLIVNVQYSSQ